MKGHPGCIEMLEAKAAVSSERLRMSKAQQEVESQRRKREGGGSRERSSSKLLTFCLPVGTKRAVNEFYNQVVVLLHLQEERE